MFPTTVEDLKELLYAANNDLSSLKESISIKNNEIVSLKKQLDEYRTKLNSINEIQLKYTRLKNKLNKLNQLNLHKRKKRELAPTFLYRIIFENEQSDDSILIRAENLAAARSIFQQYFKEKIIDIYKK